MNNLRMISALKTIHLFSSLEDEVLGNIAELFEFEDFPASTIVINQGDYGDKVYFITQGTAESFVINKNGNEVKVGALHQGEYFGELALLIDGFRTASVRTLNKCEMLSMNKDHFNKLLNTAPHLYKKLIHMVSTRLAATLHLVTKKKQNTIILLICDEQTADQVYQFEIYLSKIANKPAVSMEAAISSGEIEKINNIHNHYILIKEKIKPEKLAQIKIDYTINFMEKNDTDICLTPGSSREQIERWVRRITKKTIGIALCSGGAPGIAHLSILKVLQKENIPLDYIVGSSAGALYGGFYAFGCPIEDILKSVLNETKKSVLSIYLNNFSYNFSGFIRNSYYRKLICSMIGDKDLRDANIPFAAVASDLLTGNMIILKEGSAVDAILASNAAPVLIEPLKINNQFLIDGIATAPLPIEVLAHEKIDIKIAVPIPQLDLNTRISNDSKIFAIYQRSRAMMAERLTNLSTELADVIIKPKVEGIHMLDWTQADKILEAGEVAAQVAIKRICNLLEGKK